MPALWSVEALSKASSSCSLRVRAIHPESGGFLPSKVFALRMIYESSFDYSPRLELVVRGPLANQMTIEQVFDDDFVEANIDRYIARVAVSAPPEQQATATYEIEVADPQWLAHIQPGERWETAAYGTDV